jgi:predicted site-specific integrase-resolvase
MQPRDELGKLVDANEIGPLLGVEPRTALKWGQTGKIPCVRLSSRCTRFDIGEVQQWLKKFRVKAKH